MKYRLLALDLDGTLTNSQKVITPKTKAALMEAQKKGVRLVLASGRPTDGIMALAEELSLAEYDGFILAFNGARIIRVKTGEILYQKTLPMDILRKIFSLAADHSVSVLTYKDGKIITESPEDPYVQLESKINGIPIQQVKSCAEAVDFPVPKCLMTGNGDYMATIEDAVRDALPQQSVYRSEPYFLEIMPQNVDKAQSLSRLLEQIGLSREELIACGDGYNDLSMISYAGLGIAMANANETICEAADAVTLSNDEDGVAEVVHRYIL